MAMTPEMEAAAGQDYVLQFFALEILPPGEDPIRLLDGASGGITINDETFVGRDDQWGTWVLPGEMRNAVA